MRVRAHAVEEGLPPRPRRVQVQRTGDEGHARVPEVDEVIDGLADAVGVVDQDVAHARAGAADVHEDERHAAARELFDEPQVHLRRHDRDAVDFPLEHPPHAPRHPRRLIARYW